MKTETLSISKSTTLTDITEIRILHIEDSMEDAFLLKRTLTKAGMMHKITCVSDRKGFENALTQVNADIIISDHSLPSFNSIEALQMLRAVDKDCPFILVTGSISEEEALNCMAHGANDYILKTNLIRLPYAIEKALRSREMKRAYRTSEIMNKKLQLSFNEIEHKNSEIRSGINYAKRLIDSVMPNPEQVEKMIPSSFVLNKPKDVIGGDFFYYSKVKDGYIIAEADCTGHGTPGAMISMLGHKILTDIISSDISNSPAQILTKLNSALHETLHQSTENVSIKDGMDISIVYVNETERTITFAGANQSAYFIHDQEVTVLKGNKESIGDPDRIYKFRFTEQTLTYQPGDSILLTSDGFVDQFGGMKDKRYMRKNLMKLIRSCLDSIGTLNKSFFESAFNYWKGENEQTDDVLMIGLNLY